MKNMQVLTKENDFTISEKDKYIQMLKFHIISCNKAQFSREQLLFFTLEYKH